MKALQTALFLGLLTRMMTAKAMLSISPQDASSAKERVHFHQHFLSSIHSARKKSTHNSLLMGY